MDPEIRKRLQWVKIYEQTGNTGLTCLRCGISRPTLRQWWQRYQSFGIEGLRAKSRRPLSSPSQKVFAEGEDLILSLRVERRMGARRIKNELYRQQKYPSRPGNHPQGPFS
jgi:transposase-like protein